MRFPMNTRNTTTKMETLNAEGKWKRAMGEFINMYKRCKFLTSILLHFRRGNLLLGKQRGGVFNTLKHTLNQHLKTFQKDDIIFHIHHDF